MNNSYIKISISQISFIFLIFLTSCAIQPHKSNQINRLAYVSHYDDTITRQHLPIFIISNYNEKHNLIGTPSAKLSVEMEEEIYVNPEIASIYSETRTFTTEKESYTNVIYRIHFEKVPFSIFPFHLGWGKNVGVFVIVTLNNDDRPILYTTVQTCGCYLSFIPTSYMPKEAFPDGWNKERQMVYGMSLPSLLDFTDLPIDQTNTLIFIKNDSHRVEDVLLSKTTLSMDYKTRKAFIKPLDSLQRLPLPGVGSTSFYESSGSRKGYVKGSSKLWENILMSWWVFDWNVGVDKKLGKNKEDGRLFYTSLKPWAREESDMRDFQTFLRFWGWKL